MHLSIPTTDASRAIATSWYSSHVADSFTSTSIYYGDKGGDSQLQRWSSLIGIVTAIVGNILISFALNIQRYAHLRLHREKVLRREKSKSPVRNGHNGYGTVEANGSGPADGNSGSADLTSSFQSSSTRSSGSERSNEKRDSTYLQSPYWWGGIILMTIGEAGNFLAYGFAPASIVSPLGVVALISNCVIAPIMLKERFRLRDFWGVVVAVAGAVTVVLSAQSQERKLGPHEILDAITTLEFKIYLLVTIVLIVGLMWASPRYGNKTILVDLGLVGLFGGYTALSTKGVASMLSSTLWRAFSTPITYALLAILVGTAVMQVRYVNKALQRFDSTQVIPVQFVLFTLSVIIGSAILYRDFQKATAENVIKFIGGCLLTFSGVWLITSGRPQNDEDDDDESDEEAEAEERIGLIDHQQAGQESSLRRGSILKAGGAVDGANDVEPRSRRSSHVSFADSRPPTSRLQSNSSQNPSVRITAATHGADQADQVDTPLLDNPWKSSVDDSLRSTRHPGLLGTTSSPVLPSEAEASSSESLKPPGTPRSSSQENFHTHPNHQTGPAPPQADRPKTPRHSISRLLPGPLISPLSSGLSAVVADSLRKGVDATSRKRSRVGLRRTKSGSQRLSHAGDFTDDEYGTSPLKQTTTAEGISTSQRDDQSTWSGPGRARSLSNTLGDLFRGKRQKVDGSDNEAGIDPDQI